MTGDAFLAALRLDAQLLNAFYEYIELQKVKVAVRWKCAEEPKDLYRVQGEYRGLDSLMASVKSKMSLTI